VPPSDSADFQTVTYNGRVKVCFTPELDGGGSRYGQDYVRFVRERLGRVGSISEWCAGPGFIGFSLLAHDLCDRLTLTEINPAAVAACRATVALNGLADRVTVCLSDNLNDIPPHQPWDLVVGNPPHSGSPDLIPRLSHREPILYMDPHWEIHRRFYATLRPHLHPESAVIIQENSTFSSVEDFRGMVHAGGLEIVSVEECSAQPAGMYYYIWSKPGA
jgi:methylase of polypeptide subunit release factors